MFEPPAASDADVNSLSLPSHPLVLHQGSTLAQGEPAHLIPSDITVDYRPVDNHRALLNRWQCLHPAQQLMIGGAIGLALGVGVMDWITTPRQVVPFAPLWSNPGQTPRFAQSSLNTLYHRLGEVFPRSEGLSSATPVSEVRPFLRPVMVDRFYLANAATVGSAEPEAFSLMVDRFYFDPGALASQDVHGAQGGSGQGEVTQGMPLMVPLPPPPPSAQILPSAQRVAASTFVTSAAPEATLPTPRALPPLEPVPKVNRLIGVVQTGQFSAALVQTNQNAYAVKLGDRISQSAWQLVEVQHDAVVLSNGHERLNVYVGDAF